MCVDTVGRSVDVVHDDDYFDVAAVFTAADAKPLDSDARYFQPLKLLNAIIATSPPSRSLLCWFAEHCERPFVSANVFQFFILRSEFFPWLRCVLLADVPDSGL